MVSTAQTDYKGTLDGFQVTLKVTDSDVIIQAKNTLDSMFYQKKTTPETIASATSGLFETAQSFYQGLVDALEKKETSASISITQDAIIRYSANMTFGTQKVCLKFTIPLEDQEDLDEKGALMNLIKKLNQKVTYLEARVQSLEERKEESLKNGNVKSEQMGEIAQKSASGDQTEGCSKQKFLLRGYIRSSFTSWNDSMIHDFLVDPSQIVERFLYRLKDFYKNVRIIPQIAATIDPKKTFSENGIPSGVIFFDMSRTEK